MTRFNSNRLMKGTLLALFLFGAAAGVHAVTSESRAYLHSYNLPAHGIAIEGYSPVSYFTEGKAIRGKPEHAIEYNGVTYQLASAEEEQLFRANPDKYVPAYGGWCAFGMSIQDKFPIDPHNFKIIDGKLMLFLKNQNVDALMLWNKGDEGQNVAKADAHWKKVSQ